MLLRSSSTLTLISRSTLRSLRVPSTSSFSKPARFLPISYAAPSQKRAMASITPISTAEACPPAGPYSQAIQTPNLIFVSGQIPADNKGQLIEGSITEKTAAVFANLKAILAAAGTSLDRVVKANIFLTDMAYFKEMNAEYEKQFAGHKPARSTVAVAALPLGVPVEIELTALPGTA